MARERRFVGVSMKNLSLSGVVVVAFLVGANSTHAADNKCSLASLRGSYAVYGQGNVFVGSAQQAQEVDVGLTNFDGHGNLSGFSTFSLNGKIIRTRFVGSYLVNSDCSTTAVVKDDIGEVLHEEGIILDGGSEIRFIETDPGAVIARVARRLE